MDKEKPLKNSYDLFQERERELIMCFLSLKDSESIDMIVETGRFEHLMLLATINYEPVNAFFNDEKKRELLIERAREDYNQRKTDTLSILSALSPIIGSEFMIRNYDARFPEKKNSNFKHIPIRSKSEYIQFLSSIAPDDINRMLDEVIESNAEEVGRMRIDPGRRGKGENRVKDKIEEMRRVINAVKKTIEKTIENTVEEYGKGKKNAESQGLTPLDMHCYHLQGSYQEKQKTLLPFLIARRSKLGSLPGLGETKKGLFQIREDYAPGYIHGKTQLSEADLAMLSTLKKTALDIAYWRKQCNDHLLESHRNKVEKDRKKILEGFFVSKDSRRDVLDTEKLISMFGRERSKLEDREIYQIAYMNALVVDIQGVALYYINRAQMENSRNDLRNRFFFIPFESDNFYELNPLAHLYRAYHEVTSGMTKGEIFLKGPVELHISTIADHLISEIGKEAHGIYETRRGSIEKKLGFDNKKVPSRYKEIVKNYSKELDLGRRRLFAPSARKIYS